MSLNNRLKRLEVHKPTVVNPRERLQYFAYLFDGLNCSGAIYGSEYMGRRQWRELRPTLDPKLLAFDLANPPKPTTYCKVYGPQLPELDDPFDPDEA